MFVGLLFVGLLLVVGLLLFVVTCKTVGIVAGTAVLIFFYLHARALRADMWVLLSRQVRCGGGAHTAYLGCMNWGSMLSVRWGRYM